MFRIIFKISFFSFLFLSSLNSKAQINREPIRDLSRKNKQVHHRADNVPQDQIINSNRPGFSVSSYNVGISNFQMEAGFMGYSEALGQKSSDGKINNLSLDISLRYALSDRLEIFSNISTKRSYITVTEISSYYASPIGLGMAYRLNEGQGVIPTFSIRGSVYYYNEFDVDPTTDLSLVFTTQNQIAQNWVLISNFRMDKTFTDNNLGFILAITNTFYEDWSWFGEYYASYVNKEIDSFANLGIAYLMSNNVQLDLFGGVNVDPNKNTYYASIGISWNFKKRYVKGRYNRPVGSEIKESNIYNKYRNKGIR